MGTNTATVETLTAEVHVLKMGSRQVTNGVYRQLDCVPIEFVEPFGRVHNDSRDIRIIGRDNRNGALVRSEVRAPIGLHRPTGGGTAFAIDSKAFRHLDYHSSKDRKPEYRRTWNGVTFHPMRGSEPDCPKSNWPFVTNDESNNSCDLDALEALALEECNALVDAAIPAVETYQWAERLPLIVLASR